MYAQLTESEACQVFAQHMIEFERYDDKDNCQTVIMLFESERAGLDKVPVLVNMFINPYMTPTTIRFAISCAEKEPVDYFVDLVNLGDDTTSVEIASEMIKYFDLSVEIWEELYQLTDNFEDEEYENVNLRQFFRDQVNKVKICKGPSYLKKLPLAKLPVHPKFPTVQEVTRAITKDLRADKEKHEQYAVDTLIFKYSISSSLEKARLGNINSKFDDLALFREYGPVNTKYNGLENYPHNHECRKFGGCRLFLCMEHEDIDNDGEDIDVLSRDDHFQKDWFRGKCDQCGCKIAKKHHAFRLPLFKGGWFGCFCANITCAADNAPDDANLTLGMIGIISEQMKLYGIRDR